MRKTIFTNEEYYHIYNRGVDKREVFVDKNDYNRFLKTLKDFNSEEPTGGLFINHIKQKSVIFSDQVAKNEPLVEIVAYCLNPNHYHLILKQKIEKGISKFIERVVGGYVGYFNKKYERVGSLFQGPFKAIHIDSNDYLLYLSAYVNRNNYIHGYLNEENKWNYSSEMEYIRKDGVKNNLCEKDVILKQFNDNSDYKKFMIDKANYLKMKKEMERYLFE